MRIPIFAVLAFALVARGEDADLRRDLERAYSQWRGAIAAHDLTGWKNATAGYRQAVTRNMIVSQKQPFPEALFTLPLRPPETNTLKLVKTAAKGATANLIYFGKVDLGISEASEIPENLLVLKFIKDQDKWKFDTTRVINLAGAPDIRAELKNSGNSGFLNETELVPTGVVPTTPPPCQMRDHIGVLEITSIGYSTDAKVNGFEVGNVTDNVEQHLIIGGLKSGDNALFLSVKPTPIPEGEKREIEISAVVLTGDESKPSFRVFAWKPEATPQPSSEHNIIVSKMTMR
jgi:hypothetical protein